MTTRYCVECFNCGGEGVYGHDCGEDTCCCLEPEENDPCDTCGGRGYWYQDKPPADDAYSELAWSDED